MDRSIKVLVAEDTPVLADLVESVLEEEGYSVVVAVNGFDALRLMATEMPDIVLTDLRMPKLDGFGLSRRLRQNVLYASTPIIMMSVAEEPSYAKDLYDEFIQKPFEVEDLLRTLMRLTVQN